MYEEQFREFNLRLKDAIRFYLASTNAKASGRSGRQLNETIEPTRYELRGVGYWPFIDDGRGRTDSKRNEGRIGKIYDWLQYRKYGLNFSDNKERLSLAFAIARKQDAEGSFKFRNPEARTTILKDSIRDTLPGLLKDLTKITAIRYGNVNRDAKRV